MGQKSYKISVTEPDTAALIVTVFADDYDNANDAAAAFYKSYPSSDITITRNGERIPVTRPNPSRPKFSRDARLAIAGAVILIVALILKLFVHLPGELELWVVPGSLFAFFLCYLWINASPDNKSVN